MCLGVAHESGGEGEVSFIQLSVNEASGHLIPRF